MAALYVSPMMASAVMVTPLSVADAPMGRPILSMTSVWAALPPKMGDRASTALFSTPVAPAPTISTAATAAAMRAVRQTGLRRRGAACSAARRACCARVFFCSSV